MHVLNTDNVVLDSLAEGVFTVDKDFRINLFNSSAEQITGLKREEVIGKFCRNVFKSDLCSSNCPIARVIRKGRNIFDVDTRIQNYNGKILSIKLNASVLKDSGNNPSGGIITFREVSSSRSSKDISCPHFFGIVGVSSAMKEIFSLIAEIANTDATVFIYGETGTGKEVVANAIHTTSKRKIQKFVKVNCAVLPDQLLASELFGHAKGAFTDAIKERIGRFEYADSGSIFLDEVAEIPNNMQLQLLRVLQEGTFERLGESLTRKVNVRIIAATNVKLEDAIHKGTFRKDLFYRLNVVPIEIPPLRERKEDIPFLADHFLKKFSEYYNKELTGFDEQTCEAFYNYNWPGNVRELENAIEFAVIRTKDESIISVCDLPTNLKQVIDCPKQKNSKSELSDSDLLKLLESHHWNRTEVAKVLGINRSTLWRKLKALGIE